MKTAAGKLISEHSAFCHVGADAQICYGLLLWIYSPLWISSPFQHASFLQHVMQQKGHAPDCSICLNSLGTAAGLTRRMQASMRVLKVSTVGITPSLPISVNMPKASCSNRMIQSCNWFHAFAGPTALNTVYSQLCNLSRSRLLLDPTTHDVEAISVSVLQPRQIQAVA